MTIKPLVKSLSAIMFSTLLLTACGGGGGESDSNPTSNESSEPVVSEPITSVPITSTPDNLSN